MFSRPRTTRNNFNAFFIQFTYCVLASKFLRKIYINRQVFHVNKNEELLFMWR